MPFYTIDPYYSTKFYNECREALKNNSVEFKEYISIKPPYNWYFSIDKEPVIVNYDEASTSADTKYLVNKVNALRPNEEYLLVRRENDDGPKSLLKFVENEPLKEARTSDYAVFFTIKNRQQGEQLSRDYPGKVWFMGKYYDNKFKLCLATHRIVKGFLDPGQILLERTADLSEPGRFEAELNWKVFRQNDFLVKFTETPYFENGKFIRQKIQGEYTQKFTI